MECKICSENNCLEAFVKNVTKCTNCGSLYNISTPHEEIPVITSRNNNLKLSVQKKVSKLIAQSYLAYLKKKTKLDFKKNPTKAIFLNLGGNDIGLIHLKTYLLELKENLGFPDLIEVLLSG